MVGRLSRSIRPCVASSENPLLPTHPPKTRTEHAISQHKAARRLDAGLLPAVRCGVRRASTPTKLSCVLTRPNATPQPNRKKRKETRQQKLASKPLTPRRRPCDHTSGARPAPGGTAPRGCPRRWPRTHPARTPPPPPPPSPRAPLDEARHRRGARPHQLGLPGLHVRQEVRSGRLCGRASRGGVVWFVFKRWIE